MHKTTRIPAPPVKQPLPPYARSHLLYQFMCGCCVTYAGGTERQLRVRVAEPIPRWIQTTITQAAQITSSTQGPISHKTPASSIAKHILQTRHCVNPQVSFRIVYATRNEQLLGFAEAVAIRKHKPPLCVQKDLSVSLKLPW